jgi:hypothetical protein
MRPVVFTGTSISHTDAGKILEAEYRPPVKRDDIKRLIRSCPNIKIIGIIDGVFFDSAAVSHREIIEAIKIGITVVGGGSMGALRASELDSYGMIGVGRIYEMYSTGVLESDDEVALTFDGETGEPLSIPLVNIRATVDHAKEKGVLNNDQADSLINIARKTFYPDRNYRNILVRSLEEKIISDLEMKALNEFFKENELDLKRQDAVSVLEKIKEIEQLTIMGY